MYVDRSYHTHLYLYEMTNDNLQTCVEECDIKRIHSLMEIKGCVSSHFEYFVKCKTDANVIGYNWHLILVSLISSTKIKGNQKYISWS